MGNGWHASVAGACIRDEGQVQFGSETSMTSELCGGTMARMFLEGMPDDATPTPELVAAWLVVNTLPTEAVPMWAANWLVQGYDGQSLASR